MEGGANVSATRAVRARALAVAAQSRAAHMAMRAAAAAVRVVELTTHVNKIKEGVSTDGYDEVRETLLMAGARAYYEHLQQQRAVRAAAKMAALWTTQMGCGLLHVPLEMWHILLAREGHAQQTLQLAQVGGTCHLARALEQNLSEALCLDLKACAVEALRWWCRCAQRMLCAKAARVRSEQARQTIEMEEAAWRADILQSLVPVHQELEGHEGALAAMLGAKGVPPRLTCMEDHGLRDHHHASHPHATHGLALAFPELTALTHACGCSAEFKEIASYVRSMLVRANVAHPRLLRRKCHLRVV
jgi:hypothetical protein